MIRGSALGAMEKPEDATAAKCIWELMDAVDSYIPTPPRPVDKPFLMPIEDIFTITGRGTVVTGRVERGIVKVGEEVEIVGMQAETKKSVVTGVEMFRKLLDEGRAGDNIGALLRGIDKDEVERGQVLAKPASIKPHKKFKAEVYVLGKDEGGRHTPFFNGYRPQFYFRTTDVTGVCTLPGGVEMVMPGDNVTMAIELIQPIGDGEGAAVRDPGGGADGGRGRGGGDHGVGHARHHLARLHHLPAAELLDDEEQAHASGPHGAEEVLQVVPEARAAQGVEVTGDGQLWRRVALTARALDSKSRGWGFESLHACQF